MSEVRQLWVDGTDTPGTPGDTFDFRLHNSDEVGDLFVEISGGTSPTANVQVWGRVSPEAPFALVEAINETEVNGTTGAAFKSIRIFPQMRVEVPTATGSPTVNAWVRE